MYPDLASPSETSFDRPRIDLGSGCGGRRKACSVPKEVTLLATRLRYHLPGTFRLGFEREPVPKLNSPEILEGRDPTIFVPVGPRIRLVHHSVQDYLLRVCRADKAGSPSSHLSINLQDGQKEIAHVCSSYLRCDELQLGWIDLENRNSDGMQIMTRETKIEIRKSLETYPLLQYAAE